MSETKPLVAITGAAGFLGRAISEELAQSYNVRLVDVVEPPPCGEIMMGDITDREFCAKVCAGAQFLVISHMAPRTPGMYDYPDRCFDINVKATAMLYQEAVNHQVQRVVLISSIGVVQQASKSGVFLDDKTPAADVGLYCLTKVCQEAIAQNYYRSHQMPTAILRPSYILDGDKMEDKYGRKIGEVNWHAIDRRDIGSAAKGAIEAPDLQCEAFFVLGHDLAEGRSDVRRTKERLNWTPRHDFSQYPAV